MAFKRHLKLINAFKYIEEAMCILFTNLQLPVLRCFEFSTGQKIVLFWVCQ